MKPYVKYYHSHVAYNHYPVVNISYEGATAYCNWLTEIYNADPKRKYKSVVFRLPTEKEWEFAAAGGVENAEYSWSPDTVWTMKKGFRANFKSHGNINITSAINDNADITAPVDSYWPNNYGLYNMCGNVAEMALEEGIIKGGGFMDDIEKLKISSRETFPPECYACSDIGFRPVMIILEP
jgi:formylglycine-generating enzyme required for sulfatase activity